MTNHDKNRRDFLKTTALTAGAVALPACRISAPLLGVAAPAMVTADSARPMLEQGIQLGDIGGGRVIVWSRADREARLFVEYALNSEFKNSRIITGPHALELSDFTARQEIGGIAPGAEVFVRVWFEDLTNARAKSEAVLGQFKAIGERDNIRFVWGGDTAGQGWGINEAFGGMKIYEAMRLRQPHFFIHSGDNVYADGPIRESVIAEDGQEWKNIVTPEVAKVAETLAEFRGRYKYNLLDANVRRFNAEVPQIWQWDDHEVVNNWSASKDLSADSRYAVKDVPLLIARGGQAFREYAPLRPYSAAEPERIYRSFAYGRLLEVFVIDMRSYRGPNTFNLQLESGAETTFLGPEQMAWLKRGLKNSKAVWKIIAADMPIGLWIGDGKDAQGRDRWEGIANGNGGQPLGRELEIADLLRFIKRRRIRNTVWLTADVHYCAAHYYDPDKAQFGDFDGFWEFVAGPLNAGSFGPNQLDATFGPRVVFQKAPPAGKVNLSPRAGLQFFGEVNIDSRDRSLTIDLKDIDGMSVFSKTLDSREDRDD